MGFRQSNQKPRLFYLFSSDASPRYKRNVLDILCLPDQHIFRLRYQYNYVSKEIRNWGIQTSNIEKELKLGRKGITIYAETSEPSPYREFNFYPTREVEIVRVKVEGSIYYVDARLGKFLNYYSGLTLSDIYSDDKKERKEKTSDGNRESLHREIIESPFHPLPPLVENEKKEKYGKTWDASNSAAPVIYNSGLSDVTQGYFFSFTENPPSRITNLLEYPEDLPPNLPWESTIDVIDRAPGMKNAIFYRVLGFYDGEIKRQPKSQNLNTIYPLPMGETTTLKLLFYKSEQSWKEVKAVTNQVLEIKTKSDVFGGLSQESIPILSRYNEETIQIACKRVLDSVFAPISIELKNNEQETDGDATANATILAPQPYLVTEINVPYSVIFWLLFFTFFASIFLTVSPDIFEQLGKMQSLKQNYANLSAILIDNRVALTGFFKVLGAFCTITAAYLAFRKLPVGGK